MAYDINRVVLIGNLTRDPEIKIINDTALTTFSIAVGGLKDGVTNFIHIEAWKKTAEICGQYLKKGSRVGVDGHLKQNTWEKNGEKRESVVVVAEHVEFLSGLNKEKSDSGIPVEPINGVPFWEEK